jgi:hypothetical protein
MTHFNAPTPDPAQHEHCVVCAFMRRTDELAECPRHEMRPSGDGSASDLFRQAVGA